MVTQAKTANLHFKAVRCLRTILQKQKSRVSSIKYWSFQIRVTQSDFFAMILGAKILTPSVTLISVSFCCSDNDGLFLQTSKLLDYFGDTVPREAHKYRKTEVQVLIQLWVELQCRLKYSHPPKPRHNAQWSEGVTKPIKKYSQIDTVWDFLITFKA